MTTLQKLGKRIRQIRELRGMTQEELEEASGVNARYLSALENGKKNITVESLEKIANGLKTDILIFFTLGEIESFDKASFEKLLDVMSDEQKKLLANLSKVIFSQNYNNR